MKIALAQINPTVGDFAGNTRKILEYAERAQGLGAELAIFPELAVCGYWPADLLEKKTFVTRAAEALNEVCAWTAGAGRPAVLCGGVMPVEGASEGKQVRNVAALMQCGEMRTLQEKMLLPFYDVFDEQRYFEPAERAVADRPLRLLQGLLRWRFRFARTRGMTKDSGCGDGMPSTRLSG